MRRAERQEMATAIDNSSVLYLVEYYNDGGSHRHYGSHDGVCNLHYYNHDGVRNHNYGNHDGGSNHNYGNHDGGGGYYDAGGGHVGDDLFADGSYVGCGVCNRNPPPVSLLLNANAGFQINARL